MVTSRRGFLGAIAAALVPRPWPKCPSCTGRALKLFSPSRPWIPAQYLPCQRCYERADQEWTAWMNGDRTDARFRSVLHALRGEA